MLFFSRGEQGLITVITEAVILEHSAAASSSEESDLLYEMFDAELV